MYVRNNSLQYQLTIFTNTCFEHVSDDCLFFCAGNCSIFILQKESYCSIYKKRKKKISHHIRLRENEDLPLWRAPALRQKPPFFNVHALITLKLCAVRMRNAILRNNLKRAMSRNYAKFKQR